MTSIAVDLDNIVLPVIVMDCLGLLVEEELLLSSLALAPSVQSSPGCAVNFQDSFHWHL